MTDHDPHDESENGPDSESATAAERDPTISLASGRGRPERMLGRRLLALGAIVLLVALVGVGLSQRDTDVDDTELATGVLSSIGLDVLAGELSGQATLLEQDGTYDLLIDLDPLAAPAEGFYELWLVAADDQDRYSLGPIRSGGRFALPDGIDIDQYRVVEVSLESLDGNPSPSGAAVLRAELDN